MADWDLLEAGEMAATERWDAQTESGGVSAVSGAKSACIIFQKAVGSGWVLY